VRLESQRTNISLQMFALAVRWAGSSGDTSVHQQTTGNVESEKGLRITELAASYLGLFPVSKGHKLIQNFLQSLEPPFVVGGCASISPVHLRAVRFTDLGYFLPKFVDTL